MEKLFAVTENCVYKSIFSAHHKKNFTSVRSPEPLFLQPLRHIKCQQIIPVLQSFFLKTYEKEKLENSRHF